MQHQEVSSKRERIESVFVDMVVTVDLVVDGAVDLSTTFVIHVDD